MSMAVSGCLQYLVSKFLDSIRWQRSSDTSHVLFEVKLAEFEHQVEIILLINDFFQTINISEIQIDLLNHVWMLDALQKRDFSDSRAWNSIVFFLKLDLFDGSNLYKRVKSEIQLDKRI